MREHGYQAAIEILANRPAREIPVVEAEYRLLQTRVHDLETQIQDRVKAETAALQSNLEREFKHLTETLKLRQEAELATVQANLQQKKDTIVVLETTINDLKHELQEQRSLTSSVASAMGGAQKQQQLFSQTQQDARR